MNFRLYPLQVKFIAKERIRFPRAMAANAFRGALGQALRRVCCAPSCPGHSGRPARECERSVSCAYARLFEPPLEGPHPSGLAELPRPFVLRASHLDGAIVEAGQAFHLDLHLFETRAVAGQLIDGLKNAFEELASNGIGVERAKLTISRFVVPDAPLQLALDPAAVACSSLRVEFRTPTELKTDGVIAVRPDFSALFNRARDRISTLRALYGEGPLDIDFAGMAQRAAALVQLTNCAVRDVRAKRRSSRTGQTHPLGGFVGEAEYAGELSEFAPWLEAAQWTGVGRQAVWGKGEIVVVRH